MRWLKANPENSPSVRRQFIDNSLLLINSMNDTDWLEVCQMSEVILVESKLYPVNAVYWTVPEVLRSSFTVLPFDYHNVDRSRFSESPLFQDLQALSGRTMTSSQKIVVLGQMIQLYPEETKQTRDSIVIPLNSSETQCCLAREAIFDDRSEKNKLVSCSMAYTVDN